MRLEVWLLHPGGNPDPNQWQSHIQNQLCVPNALSWPSWLRGLLKWFLIRWRSKRSNLADMSTPCPSLTLIPQEASELKRLLGPPFRCRSLQYYGPHSMDSALSSTPARSTIFLLPLQFLRGLVLQELLDGSRKALRQSGHRVKDLDFRLLQSAYIESLAIAIRAKLIEKEWTSEYGVLLLIPTQPQSWSQMPQMVCEEAKQLMKKLQSKLQGACPTVIAQLYGHPTVMDGLQSLRSNGVKRLVACQLGSLLSDGELDTFIEKKLKHLAMSVGMDGLTEVSMPSQRTPFFRSARTLIYDSAKGLSEHNG